MREAPGVDAIFVAKTGPPLAEVIPHEGTRFALVDRDPNEYFFYTHRDEFDFVLGTARRKALYVDEWRRFLELHRPDVVHFHHALFLGYDMLRMTRRTLPDAPIVYTLHEFMPICHHGGKLVRTDAAPGPERELCDRASPRRCHECFPNVPSQLFLLRERFIKAAFEHVDLFIAPSEQLRRRYIGWGVPEERLVTEDYGRVPIAPCPEAPDAGRRRRVGFFGQSTPFKGLDVLLDAAAILLAEGTEVEVRVHTGHLKHAGEEFRRRVGEQAKALPNVRLAETYSQAQLPALIADVDWAVVPSIWWENSPLVIQEALMGRRPVICSDIGGMAEKVRDGLDGLHFRVGDPESLAEAIRRAVCSPQLWDSLQDSMREVLPMSRHVETVSGLYTELLARRTRAGRR